MQIPNSWLDYGIGALVFAAVARFMGWLQLPFAPKLSQPASPQPQRLFERPDGAPFAPQQSYTTVIDIPHRITITPEGK